MTGDGHARLRALVARKREAVKFFETLRTFSVLALRVSKWPSASSRASAVTARLVPVGVANRIRMMTNSSGRAEAVK